ncbi:MAG: hypothetical protein PGN11_19465 [Quadrisphaera sp.]
MFAFGPLDDVERLSPDYWAREQHRPVGDQEERALREAAAWARLDLPGLRAAVEPAFSRRSRTVGASELLAASSPGERGPADLLELLLARLEGFDVLVVASDERDGGAGGVRSAKVVVPGLEVETLSYGRIGERVARRLLDRGARGSAAPGGDLVTRSGGPGRLPVRLTADAVERLGGPLWWDAARRRRGARPPLPAVPRAATARPPAAGAGVSALDLLRRSQDRDLAGEGIPMALALLDEVDEVGRDLLGRVDGLAGRRGARRAPRRAARRAGPRPARRRPRRHRLPPHRRGLPRGRAARPAARPAAGGRGTTARVVVLLPGAAGAPRVAAPPRRDGRGARAEGGQLPQHPRARPRPAARRAGPLRASRGGRGVGGPARLLRRRRLARRAAPASRPSSTRGTPTAPRWPRRCARSWD